MALKKECRGKTLLQLFCEKSENTNDTCMIQYLYFGENLRQVLNSIIKAAPERIKEEDFNGFSPIEMEMMMLILCMLFERLESTHGGKRNKKESFILIHW